MFYDRLVDDSDRKWLYEMMRNTIKDQFKENFDVVFEHLAKEAEPVRHPSLKFSCISLCVSAHALFFISNPILNIVLCCAA